MNPKQNQAAESKKSFNVVLAGPGSGKTFTMVERARTLEARGIDPALMCFITFTNVGANVMRQRLRTVLSREPGYVGTLHALMLRLLKLKNPRLVVIGEEDAEDFMLREASRLKFKGSIDQVKAANRDLTPRLIPTPAMRVANAYRQFLRQEGMLDYDLVLIDGLNALCLGARLPFTHVFVDEYQDSSMLDEQIYAMMRPTERFVVGDLDQSIFGFRGADPRVLSGLWKQASGGDTWGRHVLEENYRCARSICELANAVIARNSSRVEKQTKSATGEEGELDHIFTTNEPDELLAIVQRVGRWIDDGVAPQDIAVLSRTNALANRVRDALKRGDVPIAETQDASKPKDWRLMRLIINQIAAPESAANARLLVRAVAKARKHDGDPDTAERVLEQHIKSGLSVESYFSMPQPRTVLAGNADFSRFGLSPAAHGALREKLRLFEPESIEELLDVLDEDPAAVRAHGVNVLTVHGAKGEEFKAVVVAGADMFRAKDAAEMEEARRLLFVAITRAKSRLLVTESSERTINLPGGRTITVRQPESEVGAVFLEL